MFLLTIFLCLFLLLLVVKWVVLLLFFSLLWLLSGKFMIFSLLIELTSFLYICSIWQPMSFRIFLVLCFLDEPSLIGSRCINLLTFSSSLAFLLLSLSFAFESNNMNFFLPLLFFRTSMISGSFRLIDLKVYCDNFYLFSISFSSSLIYKMQYSKSLARDFFSYSC